jgi:vacuolar-type H+-ATPase subunit E/Vma4
MTGLETIIQIIEKKTSEKIESILRDAELMKAQRIGDAEAKAKDMEQSITEKARLESKAELTRYEAGAKLRSKQEMLQAKDAVLKQVLESATEKARKVVATKQYDQLLLRLIVQGVQALNQPDVEVVLPQGQTLGIPASEVTKGIKKSTGLDVSVAIAKDTVRATGGVIVRTKDKKKWVDNTLEARLDRYSAEMRDKAATVLFAEK